MPPAITLPGLKRLTWSAHLDMPVRLTPPRETAAGPARSIILGQHEPGEDGTEPGWLVVLEVRNTGWSPIRGSDFTVPLSCAFPSRQVLAAWISPKARDRTTPRVAPAPAIRIQGSSEDPCFGRSEPERIQLGGSFRLRPADSYGIAVILTGAPAACFQHPVQPDGMLANGEVITCPSA
jgi:hypothetical protein